MRKQANPGAGTVNPDAWARWWNGRLQPCSGMLLGWGVGFVQHMYLQTRLCEKLLRMRQQEERHET